MKKFLAVTILMTALVAGCANNGDNASLNENSKLTTLAIAGTVNAAYIGNGNVKFSVTLASGQTYVEVFSRRNGAQNIAQNIVANGTPNGDGTTTYSLTASGYQIGDRVEYRFYSYTAGQTGVFTPGPQEQVWLTLIVAEDKTIIPVAKDASLIYSSYGMGIVDSRNFGASTSVDVAGYHYDTYALFGYNLNTLPAWTVVTNARLVLNNIYSAGGSAGTAVLNLVNDSTSWSEMTVTRRTTPAYTAIGTVNVPVSGAASYDVTAQVSNAVKAANAEISFMFTHTGNGNFFIDSKENTSGKATAIEVYAVAAAPVVSGYIETRWYVIGQVIRSCFMYLNFTEPAGFEGKVDHYEVYTSSDNGATWSFWFNQYGPSMNLSWTYGNKATICVSAVDTAGNKSKKSNILFLQ